jgi:hypothetical protein
MIKEKTEMLCVITQPCCGSATLKRIAPCKADDPRRNSIAVRDYSALLRQCGMQAYCTLQGR